MSACYTKHKVMTLCNKASVHVKRPDVYDGLTPCQVDTSYKYNSVQFNSVKNIK